MEITRKEIAKYIDHTLLKADAIEEDIKKLCLEADKYSFASVCVNPFFVPLSVRLLKDSSVKVCTVIGFPLGANLIETKRQEALHCVKEGAEELDMVVNISKIKDKDYAYIEREIKTLIAVLSSDIIFKLILETCYLEDDEIEEVCKIAIRCGVNFVKTSTGFGSMGAEVRKVALMKKTVGDKAEVKASGGIRDFETAKLMIENGATRLGTSSGLKIIGVGEVSGKY